MIHLLAPSRDRRFSLNILLALVFAIFLAKAFYHSYPIEVQPLVHARAHTPTGANFSYQVITSDLSVDWSDGGDFDPKDKCPEDFFKDGFMVICKKLEKGGCFKFLYHHKKKLLYRIDEDLIDNKARIGLHWVEGTSFNAKYRIADTTYKGGKTVPVPDGKGNTNPKVFQYGEAVSKKRVQRGRELFRETHIFPKQCEEWWDIFNFIP